MALYPEAADLFDEWPLVASTNFIESFQLDSGLIPWYDGGPADPWDHVESAMALSLTGRLESARKAYRWLAKNQLPDGSWWAVYESDSEPGRSRRETHRVAYVAAGVWHHYKITQNQEFLESMWPCVQNAIQFTLQFQTSHGDIEWALKKNGNVDHDSLLTGCSSIFQSLNCAIKIAKSLNKPKQEWIRAKNSLRHAIQNKPHRFDRTWESKERYAMDWFYPILCGVIYGEEARQRINSKWNQFVENGLGCRCVSDEPWITIAETCELVMALKSIGRTSKAEQIFSWIHQWLEEDGGYWTGYQFDEDVHWPEEKTTWTAGAVLLAADALFEMSEASKFFTHHAKESPPQKIARSV